MAANGRKSISNCRFQILNFRSLPSHKAMLYGRFIVFRSGRFALHPYDCALCHPLAHARPLTRLTGFRFVLFLYAGFRRCRGFTTALLLCHPAIRRSFGAPEPRRSNIGFADIAKTGCTAARSSRRRRRLLPPSRYARRAVFITSETSISSKNPSRQQRAHFTTPRTRGVTVMASWWERQAQREHSHLTAQQRLTFQFEITRACHHPNAYALGEGAVAADNSLFPTVRACSSPRF